MKRWWRIPLVMILALVLLVATPLAIMAQSEITTYKAKPDFKGALAIVAPWSGMTGKELTVRVFLRADQEPFPGAGVWAVTKEKMEALKGELAQLKDDASQPAEEKDYEKIIEAHGIFLGRTGGDGRLAHTFQQPGLYILIAAKRGYYPGFTAIKVNESIKALGIEAPKRIAPGAEITINVFDRLTQDKVEGAGIWAVTKENIEVLKAAAQAFKEDTSITAAEKDYEALVKAYAIFLGQTDKHGQLKYTFDETGGYLLVAVKQGYIPGFSPLAVISTPKALSIKANPPQAHVCKNIILNVFDHANSDPVEGASLWAVSKEQVEALKAAVRALNEDKTLSLEEKDYEAVIKLYGTFLGKTDPDGKLDITFSQAGNYLLVAVKKGCIPGFTVIPIKEMPQVSNQAV